MKNLKKKKTKDRWKMCKRSLSHLLSEKTRLKQKTSDKFANEKKTKSHLLSKAITNFSIKRFRVP